MPVRNIADAVYVVWNDTSIRKEPIFRAVGPGSDPKAPGYRARHRKYYPSTSALYPMG